MALSAAPAAKRALYDALSAVTYEEPQPGVWHSQINAPHDFHDNVTVGPDDATVRVEQVWGALGRRRRDETISIPVRILVFREGTDEFDAEARSWQLAEQIQSVIDDDMTLGIPGLRYELATSIEQRTTPFADGRQSRIDVTVVCSADQRFQ